MRARRIGMLGWACVLLLAGHIVGDGYVAMAGTGPMDPRRGAPEAERRAARRRWALAQMDAAANDGLRCRERFKRRPQIEECEAESARRYRQYNEIYLEASRE